MSTKQSAIGNRREGQSLIEILVAVSVAAIFIGGISFVISAALRSTSETETAQIASSLARNYLDSVRSVAESDWNAIYNLSGKGPSSQFHLVPSSGGYTISSGSTSTVLSGKTFTRYFSVENVNRDGNGNITQSGGADDFSAQKITAHVAWESTRSLSAAEYILRTQNAAFVQTDWSGGAGQESFATTTDGAVINNKFSTSTSNIDFSGGSIKVILP